jgi:hypothetical protein
LALVSHTIAGDAADMESPRRFVMLDPATDAILSLCSGPADDGKCPLTDTPPYLCQGLHLVHAHGSLQQHNSFTVGEMVPGRCPLTSIDEE